MKHHRFRLLLPLILLLSTLLVPQMIPYHRNPLTSFWNEWWAGFLVVLAWGLGWFFSSRRVVISAALLPWAIWGIAWLVAASFAHYRMIGPVYWAGLFWIVGALCLLLVGQLKHRLGYQWLVSAIAITLMFSGLLQALFGLLKFYGLLTWFSPFLSPSGSHRLVGPLNYPTICGFFIWLGVYAGLYLYLNRKISAWGLIAALLPMSMAIVATGDRSSLLYGAMIIALLSVLYVRHLRVSKSEGLIPNDCGKVEPRRMLASALLVCGVAVLMVPVYGKVDHFLQGRLVPLGYIHNHVAVEKTFHRRGGNILGIRGSEFRKALYLAKSHFWTGVGPGHYPYESFRLDSVLKGTVREGSVNGHSHNIFSMVLVEDGVIGVIAVVFGMMVLFVWWWRLGVNPESLFLGLVLAAYFIFSNIEYPLWYLNFLVIFLIFCALSAPTIEKRLDTAWLLPVLSVMTLVIGVFIAINMERGFNQVASVQVHSTLDKKKLRSLSFWAMDRLVEPFSVVVVEKYLIPKPKDIDRQIRLADKEIHRLPMPKALLDKAILLLFEGKQGQACALAERTAYSYPIVLNQYVTALQEYASEKLKLPADPASLAKCFQKGYAGWKKQ